jgi:hypothetical protein
MKPNFATLAGALLGVALIAAPAPAAAQLKPKAEATEAAKKKNAKKPPKKKVSDVAKDEVKKEEAKKAEKK